MRNVAHHAFFKKLSFGLKRYRDYLIGARMLLLAKHGICDVGPSSLYEFFRKNSEMDSSGREAREVTRVLNYLDKTFPHKTGELNNDSWITNLYLVTSDLLKKYVMNGREKDLRDFYVHFWIEAEGLKEEKAKPPKFRIDQKFVLAMSSGTTGEDRIATRIRTMEENFIASHPNLELLDPKREFDRYEKAVIYLRDKGRCQWPGCHKPVPWTEYEADHIHAWSKGGKTTVKNGQVLCRAHNRKKSDSM